MGLSFLTVSVFLATVGGVQAPTAAASTRPIVISGAVDAAMFERFAALDVGAEVTVRSGGGNAGVGEQIAVLIEEKRIAIRIDGLCASACAEFFLPATPALTLEPTAVIALHLNDFAFEQIMAAEPLPAEGLCSAPRAASLRGRYARHGLNEDFYEEGLKRLEFLRYERVVMAAGCLSQNTWTRHVAWLPSSRQLRTMWGLPIAGPVCIDDGACRQTAVNRYFTAGKTVVVGDEVVRSGD